MTAYLKTFPPHIHSSQSVPEINWRIALSLVPVFLVSILAVGLEVFRIELITIGTAVSTEYFSSLLFQKKNRLTDGSSFLIGLFLGLLLPATLPVPLLALASFISVFLGKEIFGGLAANPFHPVLVGYLFLFIAFPVESRGGASLADAGPAAVMLAAFFLAFQRLVDLAGPLIYVALLFIFSPMLGASPYAIFSGNILFIAFFLISDPVTTPLTRTGRLLFAAGAALLGLGLSGFRISPAPFLSAVFLMNALSPWLDHWIRPKPVLSKS